MKFQLNKFLKISLGLVGGAALAAGISVAAVSCSSLSQTTNQSEANSTANFLSNHGTMSLAQFNGEGQDIANVNALINADASTAFFTTGKEPTATQKSNQANLVKAVQTFLKNNASWEEQAATKSINWITGGKLGLDFANASYSASSITIKVTWGSGSNMATSKKAIQINGFNKTTNAVSAAATPTLKTKEKAAKALNDTTARTIESSIKSIMLSDSKAVASFKDISADTASAVVKNDYSKLNADFVAYLKANEGAWTKAITKVDSKITKATFGLYQPTLTWNDKTGTIFANVSVGSGDTMGLSTFQLAITGFATK